jgi:hypothetical protein
MANDACKVEGTLVLRFLAAAPFEPTVTVE